MLAALRCVQKFTRKPRTVRHMTWIIHEVEKLTTSRIAGFCLADVFVGFGNIDLHKSNEVYIFVHNKEA